MITEMSAFRDDARGREFSDGSDMVCRIHQFIRRPSPRRNHRCSIPCLPKIDRTRPAVWRIDPCRDRDFTGTADRSSSTVSSRCEVAQPVQFSVRSAPDGQIAAEITMDNASAPPQATSCLVCGATRAEPRFVQRGYPVFRCTGCSLEFVAPIPSASELADYYNRAYTVPLERYAAAGHRNIARIADLERWCPSRGRLLEFGASYGHSLASARERGWDVAGVELSPTASEYARAHFGLAVFNCDLADAPLTDGSFDAVIGWHVLEHVRNPKDQLLRLSALLTPGGVLGLRVPNIASFGARAAGQWWPWMCPPAHLWFFSATTLPRLLQACGFEVQEVKTWRGDGNNLCQYALMAGGNWLNDLRLRLRSRRDANTRPRRRQHRALAAQRSQQRRQKQRGLRANHQGCCRGGSMFWSAHSRSPMRWRGLLEA